VVIIYLPHNFFAVIINHITFKVFTMIFGRKSREPDVWEMKEKRNVTGLIKALDYKDKPSVRWNAAQYLGRIGDPRAAEPLIHVMLNDPEPTCRAYAAAAFGDGFGSMGGFRDQRAIEPLIKALNDPDPKVRRFAASSLEWNPDPRAVEPLIRLLDDYETSTPAMRALVVIGEPAVVLVTRALSDENEKIRERAQKILENIRTRLENQQQ
jgi:HEAT repeat protein